MSLPFSDKKIPIKLELNPIVDASAEIRFNPILPPGAVFGILYSAFQQEYPELEVLQFQNLPEELRLSNPDLMYQPHYRIKGKDFAIQIGPQVLSLGSLSYPGWGGYLPKLISTFKKVKELRIADNITRVGLRYVNFFPNIDIFEKLDTELLNKNSLFIGRNSLIRTEIEENGLLHTLQLGNNGNLVREGENIKGSHIDIDTSVSGEIDNFFDVIHEQVTKLHDAEKKVFFGLLDDNYLKTYNPEYA